MLRRENGALLAYVVSSCTGGGESEKGHQEKGQTAEDTW